MSPEPAGHARRADPPDELTRPRPGPARLALSEPGPASRRACPWLRASLARVPLARVPLARAELALGVAFARLAPARVPLARVPFARVPFARAALARAAPLILRTAELRREDLPAQRPADQIHGAGGLDQPAALGAVDLEHGLHPAGRQLPAELGAGGPVPFARAADTGGYVMPGEHRERVRVPAQHAVQPVVGRHHIEQPGHRGLLELLAVGRMNAGRPARRKVRCHLTSISRRVEHKFDTAPTGVAGAGSPASGLPGRPGRFHDPGPKPAYITGFSPGSWNVPLRPGGRYVRTCRARARSG